MVNRNARNAPAAPPAPPPPGPSSAKKMANAMALLLVLAVFIVALLGVSEAGSLAAISGLLSARRAEVGLLAGHWKNDSGAVCDDGLTEVEINLAVANAVATRLRANGIHVEVLPEYDSRLNGYRARAFVAIHTDSCVDLSGFKLARMTHSDDPEAEDRLVQTLYRTYAAATGLTPHEDTITEDMRQYHALRRISPGTPGAIIEIGFMGGDRYLLTRGQDRVAKGIADGILAFLDASQTPGAE